MSYRKKGLEALATVINQEQTIQMLEKHIYNTATKQSKIEPNIEDVYKDIMYQYITDFLKGGQIKQIMDDISNEKIGWKHSCYTHLQNMLDEQNDFIENPFAVEEGVLECKARDKDGNVCGSKRVFSYQRQVRSADEPMTTFATCCNCGTKWQYSG